MIVYVLTHTDSVHDTTVRVFDDLNAAYRAAYDLAVIINERDLLSIENMPSGAALCRDAWFELTDSDETMSVDAHALRTDSQRVWR